MSDPGPVPEPKREKLLGTIYGTTRTYHFATYLTRTATLMFAATGAGAELAEPVLLEADPVLKLGLRDLGSYSGSVKIQCCLASGHGLLKKYWPLVIGSSY